MDIYDYDKILLSFKEKRLLKQLIREKEVPVSFCNDNRKAVFLKYGLISIIQDQMVTSSGRVTYIAGTERIKEFSKYKNVPIKDLLNECGLSKNTLSSMLSGGSTPKSENLAKIADYLDCSIDYLMDRTNNPEINK